MITNEVYQKALAIVTAYHDQIRLEAIEIKEIFESRSKKEFRNLEEVTSGDSVKCLFVHSSSTKHLTIEKEYEVLNTDGYRFQIKVDSEVKKWYYKTNTHFKLI